MQCSSPERAGGGRGGRLGGRGVERRHVPEVHGPRHEGPAEEGGDLGTGGGLLFLRREDRGYQKADVKKDILKKLTKKLS